MNDKLYKLMNWPKIEGIVYSEEDNPHALLGPHVTGSGILVQTFQPGAEAVTLCVKNGKKYRMELADEAGYFAVLIPGRTVPEYTYVVQREGVKTETEDAYRFGPVITPEDAGKWNAGIHYEAYRILGAHLMRIDKVDGVHFAVWAPGAMRVSVVGDFNGWDGRVHQMRRLWDSGIFEIFVPGVKEGSNYKFELKIRGGLTYLKADPCAFGQQLRPETASVVRNIDGFHWEDAQWMEEREKKQAPDAAVSVYEMHLASFRKPDDGREFYNYRELAPHVTSYIREMGYTHVELMPVMEHPFDASWGYQVIGYYAPTSRYGTPEDFMYFVNELHKAGIGVILDWVPAHFPRDTYGLSNFDGTCLYEHLDPRKGSHPHWGTLIYNYGRPEVANYLIANALYWVERFHADGIRMDAVASMLYLDYGKQDGEWVANLYGGNENLEAMEFLKHLNSVLHRRNPGAITVAEESTAWPRVTGSVREDGLGFDYKWNMGWMNDYLEYIKYDPYFRAHHHGELTFSMVYAYSEKFMLVFSHDEVVHGKKTMIGKMPGERREQFANLRATYAYMMVHPGKKLLFMGQDIAEYDEWNEERQVEWELLGVHEHNQVNRLVRELNGLYRTHPALYELDYEAEGFEWINSIDYEKCMLSFLRRDKKGEDTLLVVVNFANVARNGYRVGVPEDARYKEILNTDDKVYGGNGVTNPRIKDTVPGEWDGREYSVKINVGPLSVCVFEKRDRPVRQDGADQNKAERKKAGAGKGSAGKAGTGKESARKTGTGKRKAAGSKAGKEKD